MQAVEIAELAVQVMKVELAEEDMVLMQSQIQGAEAEQALIRWILLIIILKQQQALLR